jgi:inosine-uridine nucleoside N-ribohydrolase
VQDTVLNLDRLLTWLDGEPIPIGLGAEGPLLGNMAWFEDWRAGYQKTLPWHPRRKTQLAASLMIDTIYAYPGQVSILALGPMTNLALAVRLEPTIVPLTRQVIVMGGSFRSRDRVPEFNVRCDPEAAQMVFSAGWVVHVLGLEITRRVHFSRSDFSSLRDGNPAVELLRAQAPGWIKRVEAMGWEQDGCALHDAVAVAYLVDNAIFETEKVSVEVELIHPESRGVTQFSTAAEGKPTVTAIRDLDIAKCRELIWSHLQQ